MMRQHSESFFRFTYRKGLAPLLPSSTLTSDSGWGCMLRVAQMLMASTLRRHYLGNDWRQPRNSSGLIRRRALVASSEYCNVSEFFSYVGINKHYATTVNY
mmetsp:Transcript_5723/g.9437  ORF Transcript_5723/g.9437 Transcript_5723/m.9437 type:complete len:101 (-) Transcript_5723:248-550(-)